MKLRLQKFLANSGICSRRKAEEHIQDGEVKVNGKLVTEMGILVDPEKDAIMFRNKRVAVESRKVAYALYKPKNCITSLNDPEGRDTIANYFPKVKERLFTVGRLDYDAEGLIFVTNDGEFANTISHPKSHLWKTYFVKIKGKISLEETKVIEQGQVIDGKKLQKTKVKILHFKNDKTWLEVRLKEGVNRQIKKSFDKVGFRVLKIKRFSIGDINLGELSPGESRKLNVQEVESLIQLAD